MRNQTIAGQSRVKMLINNAIGGQTAAKVIPQRVDNVWRTGTCIAPEDRSRKTGQFKAMRTLTTGRNFLTLFKRLLAVAKSNVSTSA